MLSEYKLENKKIPVNSSYGVVFRGKRIDDGKKVAVKFNVDTSPENITRFERENMILFNLNHIGIIKALTRIESDTFDSIVRDYYVMELADSTFEHWLFDSDAAFASKIEIFRQICHALLHAHDNNYIHRDLHFRNILMSTEHGDQIKLIDFGRAYDFNDPLSLSEQPAWGGLVMPPEVRFGALPAAQLDNYKYADIYSLGIIWKLLFYVGYAPISDLQEINASIYSYIGRAYPQVPLERYYESTTLDERKKLFEKWLTSEMPKFDDYFEIPLLKVDLGMKLGKIQKSIMNFDPSQRLESIDDVINLTEGL